MTDQALKGAAAFAPAMLNSAISRTRQSPPMNLGDKVVSLALATPEESAASSTHAPARDWSAALVLVQEASEAIRISEERATQLEERLAQVLSEAREEIERLNLLVADGEQKRLQAEERANLTELRAAEAEAWLAKLHDTVVASFRPVLRKELKSSSAL